MERNIQPVYLLESNWLKQKRFSWGLDKKNPQYVNTRPRSTLKYFPRSQGSRYHTNKPLGQSRQTTTSCKIYLKMFCWDRKPATAFALLCAAHQVQPKCRHHEEISFESKPQPLPRQAVSLAHQFTGWRMWVTTGLFAYCREAILRFYLTVIEERPSETGNDIYLKEDQELSFISCDMYMTANCSSNTRAAEVALALGVWCLVVSSRSFVKHGVVKQT